MKIAEAINKLGELVVIKKWEPIGSVKMFDREQDMSKLYYGTWELTLLERSPIGVNPNSTDIRFQTAGQQFGEKEHSLTISELPKLDLGVFYHSSSTYQWQLTSDPLGGVNKINGGGQAHNNIHPVETIYFYKRTA